MARKYSKKLMGFTIRHARECAGLSLDQVVSRADIPIRRLQAYERGARIPPTLEFVRLTSLYRTGVPSFESLLENMRLKVVWLLEGIHHYLNLYLHRARGQEAVESLLEKLSDQDPEHLEQFIRWAKNPLTYLNLLDDQKKQRNT